MANTYIQIRTNEEDKKAATEILNALGTNLSAVLNMAIKQIIIQKRIPFDVALPEDYIINNVKATMEMSDMPLSDMEVEDLKKFGDKSKENQEKEIKDIIRSYKK